MHFENGSHYFKTVIVFLGDNRPSPSQVRIEGCDQLPCRWGGGGDIPIEIDFKAPVAAEELNPNVRITVLGLGFDWPLAPELRVGCNQIVNAECPLAAQDEAMFQTIFPGASGIPPLPVQVEITITNEQDEDIFCTQFDVNFST